METLTLDGRKLEGVLHDVTPESFMLTIQEKVREEGAKRPKLVDRDVQLKYSDVKWTKYIIDFK